MMVDANRTAAIHHRRPETVRRIETEGAVNVILWTSSYRDSLPSNGCEDISARRPHRAANIELATTHVLGSQGQTISEFDTQAATRDGYLEVSRRMRSTRYQYQQYRY